MTNPHRWSRKLLQNLPATDHLLQHWAKLFDSAFRVQEQLSNPKVIGSHPLQGLNIMIFNFFCNQGSILVKIDAKIPVLVQGPRQNGWHGWQATRQCQAKGGSHPSNLSLKAYYYSKMRYISLFGAQPSRIPNVATRQLKTLTRALPMMRSFLH